MPSRNWNTYNQESWSVGGGVPVWAEPPKRYIAGGIIKNTLVKGEKLAGCTPVDFDVKTKEAKLLKCYQVVSVNGTKIVVSKAWDLPVPRVGEAIMIAPDTIDGTGQAVTVVGVVEVSTGLEVTVDSAITGVAAGNFLVEAKAAGASSEMYCKPWTFTIEDTIAGDFNTVGIARGVKYVYENTIPLMPKVVRDNIKLVEWDWFGEYVQGGNYAEDVKM